jgi:beta-lactam-binding protein with PASTA domain
MTAPTARSAPTAPKPTARPARPGAGWRTRARGLLPYAVTAASGFVIGYLIIYLFVFPSALVPTDRPVPNVIGLLDLDARRALGDAGFQVRLGEQRVNTSVPPSTVLRQNPIGESRKPKGTTVTIDVSATP